MNERIKELIFEAVSFRLDPDSNAYEAQVSPEDLKYLAELLILECIDLVESTPRHCAFTTYQLGIVECTIQKSSERLHEHFGIQRQFKITGGQLPVSK